MSNLALTGAQIALLIVHATPRLVFLASIFLVSIFMVKKTLVNSSIS